MEVEHGTFKDFFFFWLQSTTTAMNEKCEAGGNERNTA